MARNEGSTSDPNPMKVSRNVGEEVQGVELGVEVEDIGFFFLAIFLWLLSLSTSIPDPCPELHHLP